jgi:hypothetical protein
MWSISVTRPCSTRAAPCDAGLAPLRPLAAGRVARAGRARHARRAQYPFGTLSEAVSARAMRTDTARRSVARLAAARQETGDTASSHGGIPARSGPQAPDLPDPAGAPTAPGGASRVHGLCCRGAPGCRREAFSPQQSAARATCFPDLRPRRLRVCPAPPARLERLPSNAPGQPSWTSGPTVQNRPGASWGTTGAVKVGYCGVSLSMSRSSL